MSGDSNIAPVGGALRAVSLRKIAGGAAAPLRAPAPLRTAEAMPATRLIGLGDALADQPPPVDAARVGALRAAIASGGYSVHPTVIAGAMLDFYKGGAD